MGGTMMSWIYNSQTLVSPLTKAPALQRNALISLGNHPLAPTLRVYCGGSRSKFWRFCQ